VPFVGGLVFPQRVVLRQLLTNDTRVASGFDDDFREVKLVDSNADGIGEEQRKESPELILMAQVATRHFEFADQAPSGRVPETTDLELTFHFKDLADKGLVAADGLAKLVAGDRLVRIEDGSGSVVHAFPNPPGMFLVAARPSGFMVSTRNLLVCTFSDRRRDAVLPFPREKQL
jgi:hypothetical protein